MPTLPQALLAAQGRGILPSALGTRGLRERFTQAVRARAVFSARTTSAVYLAFLRKTVEDLLRGEVADVDKEGQPWMRSVGQAEQRLILKQALAALGYDSEAGGFVGAGSEVQGARSELVDPAPRGSLRDLASDRRLDLILDTQRARWQAVAQQQRGTEPGALKAFPCWELVPGRAMEPRMDWPQRWMAAGGVLYGEREDRLIAHKLSPVWQRLGELSEWNDVIDGGQPPFAFGSKRYWVARSRSECLALGVDLTTESTEGTKKEGAGKGLAGALPTPVWDVPDAVTQEGREGLRAALKATLSGKRLTFEERLERSLAEAQRNRG